MATEFLTFGDAVGLLAGDFQDGDANGLGDFEDVFPGPDCDESEGPCSSPYHTSPDADAASVVADVFFWVPEKDPNDDQEGGPEEVPKGGPKEVQEEIQEEVHDDIFIMEVTDEDEPEEKIPERNLRRPRAKQEAKQESGGKWARGRAKKNRVDVASLSPEEAEKYWDYRKKNTKTAQLIRRMKKQQEQEFLERDQKSIQENVRLRTEHQRALSEYHRLCEKAKEVVKR